MIPVVGIGGEHQAGKTTFALGLIRELRADGFSVAVVKHTSQPLQLDHSGTDTALYSEAGCAFVAIAGPYGSAILLPQPPEPNLWELAARVPPSTGVIVVEGYRSVPLPRFEVLVKGEPVSPRDQLLAAVVRELPDETRGYTVLASGDYRGAADLLYARGVLVRPWR
ncbi:MAG: molybdopterin-guanine dinucleotide biosynthesis protein B [Chloroflexi bacterium]|nr:molybdopterin-guanine dinucleotide biosynthesis protein B [Chloroflexota bacterium]